jgi:hypothetical protein
MLVLLITGAGSKTFMGATLMIISQKKKKNS